MSKRFFNYVLDDMGFAISDGNMLMRMGDNMVMNMDTGEPELISGSPDDDRHSIFYDDDEE